MPLIRLAVMALIAAAVPARPGCAQQPPGADSLLARLTAEALAANPTLSGLGFVPLKGER